MNVEQIDWGAVTQHFQRTFKSADEARAVALTPWLKQIPPTCVLTPSGELVPRLNKYIPVTPTPKQADFLKLADKDVFYGGAAGGGKSIALLMAAAQFLDVPGYHALVLRRTFSELSLPGALMDIANKWWPQYRKKDGKEYWFPTDGGPDSRLVFGFLETSRDWERYQSAEFHSVNVDEVTEFTHSDFSFMWSRLRNPPAGVPLRMRSASNPNGIGRLWVKHRYVDEATRGERVFVPSLIDDNPYLRESAEYKENLATQLGPVQSAQLLKGDWEIQASGLFMRQWFKIADVLPIDGARFVRYWDLAATEPTDSNDPDYTVGALVGQYQHQFFIADLQRARLTPRGVEDLITQTARVDRQTYGNVRIRMEQEPGASGVRVIDDYVRLLAGYDFRGDKVTGPKEIRANALAAQAERGNVFMLAARWNKDALDEFEVFPGGGHDDIVDACSGAFNELTGVPPVDTKAIFMVGERLRPDW